MPLFKVEVRAQFVVLADSGTEAQMVAQRVMDETDFDEDWLVFSDHITDESQLPAGWKPSSIPWHEDREDVRTVRQILAAEKGWPPKPPYTPGTRYGLLKRANLRKGSNNG